MTTESDAFLAAYSLHLEQSVIWGDMDAFGHINNTVYFRYFEDARMAFFERAGAMEYMDQHQVGPILASTQCRFRSAVKYPDQLLVATRAEQLRESDFVMVYGVFSLGQNRLVAEGEGRIVYFDYRKNTKAVIPEVIARALD